MTRNTIEFKNYFVIKPEIILTNYRKKKYNDRFKSVSQDFEYISNRNTSWLDKNLRMIKTFLKKMYKKVLILGIQEC